MYKVGIPKALLYYKYYLMWSTFLRELGAEVVVSDNTNKQTIAEGASRVVSDTCVPVKVFTGHAALLKDKCDFLLIPALRSFKKKVLNCSRFLGLPDMIKAVVPGAPPIIDIEFDINRGRLFLYKQILVAGRHFSSNPFKIRKAAEHALREHLRFYDMMAQEKLTYTEGIERFNHPEQVIRRDQGDSRALNIGLIGHPYVLHDEQLSHRMITRLRQHGAAITTPEMLTFIQLSDGMKNMSTKEYWTAEDDVIGAGGHYISHKYDGIIGMMAFGCGPDSMMMNMVQMQAHNAHVPFMSLTVEEHTAEAGILTRIEAFLDMIHERRRIAGQHESYVSAHR